MSSGNKNIVLRLAAIYAVLLLAFVVPIIYKIIEIQVIEGDEWRERAKESSIAQRKVQAQRGTIFSSDGKILATSLPIYDVYIDLGVHVQTKPKKKRKSADDTKEYIPMVPDTIFMPYVEELSKKLADMFLDKTPEEYHAYLMTAWEKKNRNTLIHKNVSFTQLEKMKSFPILCRPVKADIPKDGDTISANTIDKKEKPRFRRAVIVRERNIRINPYKNLARHTIGFEIKHKVKTTKDGKATTKDSSSFNGLDGFYNSYLCGQQGERLERRLNKDVWIPVNDTDQKRAINGQDIVATIDTRLQDLAETSLRRCLIENDADYGCVVLMEVETGYVRAISNLSLVDSARGYQEIRNIACTDLYEPGSTFKTITAMVLIDNNKCDTSYIVPTGVKRFNPKNKHSEIHDVRDYSHGNISMKRSFEVSSNVGTCQPVWDFYNDNRKEFANSIKKIMPYKRLNIDLAVGGEPTPHLESDLNPDRNFLNLAYGYSSNITALQLLTFYNAIANNGTMVKPIFCSEIKEGEKTIKTIRPEVINEEICSARTLKIIQSMLEGVVENGSARRLSKTPYGIAGKTGTSQINYTQKNKTHMTYRASFAGYFPADNPKYSCIVVITNPKKNKQHGGEIAAPVFKDLADRVCGTILNIEMDIPSKDDEQKPFITRGFKDDVQKSFEILDIDNTYENDDDAIWIGGAIDTNNNIVYRDHKITYGKVPNCKGMTIKDAIYMLEKMGLKVSFDGRGKVISQAPKAGTPINKNGRVHLKLGIGNQVLPQDVKQQPNDKDGDN